MFVRSFHNVAYAVAMLAVWAPAWAPRAAEPMKQVRPAALVSTATAHYRTMQGEREAGREFVTRTAYDNNTIQYACSFVVSPASGMGMTQKLALTLEEESHFPRTYRAEKVVTQGGASFTHILTADMFANVAVLGSELNRTSSTRRVVVPTGVAIVEPGIVHHWYQILFWVDASVAGRQRFQWVDPTSGKVEAGEIWADGQDTITVLGKKTPVTVFKAERERLGPATLWVDARKRIVRCEQNLTTSDLAKWSEK